MACETQNIKAQTTTKAPCDSWAALVQNEKQLYHSASRHHLRGLWGLRTLIPSWDSPFLTSFYLLSPSPHIAKPVALWRLIFFWNLINSETNQVCTHTTARAESGCVRAGNPIKIIQPGGQRAADEMRNDFASSSLGSPPGPPEETQLGLRTRRALCASATPRGSCLPQDSLNNQVFKVCEWRKRQSGRKVTHFGFVPSFSSHPHVKIF